MYDDVASLLAFATVNRGARTVGSLAAFVAISYQGVYLFPQANEDGMKARVGSINSDLKP